MRVLRGVVYMMKSKGSRTEPRGTLQEEKYKEDRWLSHLTRKDRDDRYDSNQLRTEPRKPNQDEKSEIRMSWSMVSKAAERSRRQRLYVIQSHLSDDHEYTKEQFQWNDAYSKQIGED